MQSIEPKELGRLFGRYPVWPEDYLPEPKGGQREGVLSNLLKNADYEIESLESYRKDYSKFYKSYSPSGKPETGELKTSCDVPYWTQKLWKTQKRIVILGQKSQNKGEASIPLYSPLFEVGSWKKALNTGLKLNKKQNNPYSWKSFMLNWMAMRVIFSNEILALKQIYYTDVEKFGDGGKNEEILEDELSVVKPKFIIVLGKSIHNNYGSFLQQRVSEDRYNWVYFPSGQGTRYGERAENLKKCRENLEDLLKNES